MNDETSRLANDDIARAKVAFTIRRVDLGRAKKLLSDGIAPSSGDLLLARVSRIGQQKRIELTNGRRARLFHGDKIVVCYGNRYAPHQFEAVVPDTMGPCHLVAAGGIAGRVLSKHDKMKEPTKLIPLGILANSKGRPLNLGDFALESHSGVRPQPLTLAVAGTAMDSGKTTTAASVIRGLTASGLKVGAAKVTGTGAGGDLWFMKDAGADPVFDFVDAGLPSTYRATPRQIDEIVALLNSHLRNGPVDAIVLEVSDGLYQEETAGLFSSAAFQSIVHGIIFAANDAMGAKTGVEWLWQRDLPVLALSGVLTSSPLATREAQEAVGLPILKVKTLCDPAIASIVENLLASQLATRSVTLRAV